MKTLRVSTFILTTVLIHGCARSPAPAFDTSSYPPSTLAEANRDLIPPDPNVDFTLSVLPFKYRVRVSCGAQQRPIRSSVRALIAAWARSFKPPPLTPEMFQNEVLVREGNTEYWMPIQQSLLSYWETELVTGDPVELLVAWIGSTNSDPVFLVNAFTALGSPSRQ